MTVHGRARDHMHVPCREGNNWSHAYCRRQWSLADADHLRYRHLVAFEAALHALDDQYHYVGSPHQIAFADDAKQVLTCGRAHFPGERSVLRFSLLHRQTKALSPRSTHLCSGPKLAMSMFASCLHLLCIDKGQRGRLLAMCPNHGEPAWSGSLVTNSKTVSARAQVIVAERGPLVWVFNFSPFNDYEGFKARPSWPHG